MSLKNVSQYTPVWGALRQHMGVLWDTTGTSFFQYKMESIQPNENQHVTREDFLRKNIVAVSFFQNCAIHPYS